MSTRPGAPPTGPDPEVVQRLLAERRELMIVVERLRLTLDEARASERGPDPRIARLEAEVRRLREELAAAAAEVDVLREGVLRALARLGG